MIEGSIWGKYLFNMNVISFFKNLFVLSLKNGNLKKSFIFLGPIAFIGRENILSKNLLSLKLSPELSINLNAQIAI